MIRHILRVFAAATVLPPAAWAQAPDAYYAAWQDARAAVDRRDYPRAIELLETLAAKTPTNTDLWLLLADVYTRTLDRAGAIDAARRAIELGSRTPPWFVAYRIAGAFGRLGEPDSTLAWAARALDLGWGDRWRFLEGDAFELVHGDERFHRLVGTLPPGDVTRAAGWRHDLAYFLDEVRRLHTGPSLPDLPPTFERDVAALQERVGTLGDDEILLALQELVSRLGDGHSWITSFQVEPSEGSGIHFDRAVLPLRFYLFSDGLFVVNATEQHRQWIGHRVVRFGDLSADDAIAAVAAYIARDNWQGVRDFAPTLLRSLVHLRATGATTGNTVTLTLAGPRGDVRQASFDGGTYSVSGQLEPPDTDAPIPLHLQNRQDAYWVTTLPDHDALYMQFNSVRDGNGLPSLERFPSILRDTLERTGAANLIIDVRYNGGGNNTLLRPLLRILTWWEVDSPERRIYLITGRRTFSAAQNFVNRVERMTDVVIAGEPSSSRPNFVGEASTLRLPYSGLRGSISNRYWQDSDSGDMRQWIAPHIPAELSSEDYFANRDPVLEAVLRVIASGR